MPEQGLAEPHADDMGDDQRGDAQAQYELQRLDGFPAKLPALVEGPDTERGVNHGGGVEHDRDGKKLPEQRVVVDADGQRIHRDVAERMVKKMTEEIGKQHQTAGQADLPDADAAERCGEPGSKLWGHVVHKECIVDSKV